MTRSLRAHCQWHAAAGGHTVTTSSRVRRPRSRCLGPCRPALVAAWPGHRAGCPGQPPDSGATEGAAAVRLRVRVCESRAGCQRQAARSKSESATHGPGESPQPQRHGDGTRPGGAARRGAAPPTGPGRPLCPGPTTSRPASESATVTALRLPRGSESAKAECVLGLL